MKAWWTITLVTAATAATAAATGSASAQTEAKLQPAQSEVLFQVKQMGVPVEGRFRKFDAQIAFDPKKPETGKVALQIDTASATMGSAEVDSELPKPVWFGVAKFPQASFASTSIKGLGGARFEITGKLSIKGQVRDIVVPVTLTAPAQAGGPTLAAGSFSIKRVEFLVGEKEWADVSLVANDVLVRFKLALVGIGAL